MTPSLLLLLASAVPSQVSAGVYAPGLYFPTSVAKGTFFNDVEKQLGESLGEPVRVSAVSRPEELDAFPIWIVDAEVAVGRGATIVQQARRSGKGERPVTLYATKKPKAALTLLTTGRVAFPGATTERLAALRYAVLLDEPGSKSYLGRLRPVRDVAAALTALAAGELEGAIAPALPYGTLDPNLARLEPVAVLPALPLPVLAFNPKGGSRYVKALERAKLPAIPNVVSGWGTPLSGSLNSLQLAIRSRSSRVQRTYAMIPLAPIRLDLVSLLKPPPALPELNATVAMPLPEEPELPELPYVEASAPVVARR